mmetsp:Transcript_56892/g.130894  ORF Transcript_56892/g.130894 Transcript_56892/m.130894 type:complete len:796 (-) Transcript_56892:190-2577(-)
MFFGHAWTFLHCAAASEWEPLNVVAIVDEAAFAQQVPSQEIRSFLLDDVVGSALLYLQAVLKVPARSGNLTVPPDCEEFWPGSGSCHRLSDNWACGRIIIPEDHRGMREVCVSGPPPCSFSGGSGAGVSGNFVLYVTADESSCDENSLGSATSCRRDLGTDRPIAAAMNFCPTRVISRATGWRQDVAVVVHEMIHALGFSVTHFPYWRRDGLPRTSRNAVGEPVGVSSDTIRVESTTGTPRWFLSTEKVVKFARTFFRCESIDGVPLEDQGGGGVAYAHWERRVALQDILSPIVLAEPMVSGLVLSALDDAGWYQVNYNWAGEMAYGRHAGCAHFSACIANDQPTAPMFCSPGDPVPTCSSGVPSRPGGGCSYDLESTAFCNACSESSWSTGLFTDQTVVGPLSMMNTCPIWVALDSGASCTTDRDLPDRQDNLGEHFGKYSRCVLASVGRDQAFGEGGSCRRIQCHPGIVQVFAGDSSVNCTVEEGFAGIKKSIDGWFGEIVCPDYFNMCFSISGVSCSGRGVRRSGMCWCPPGFLHIDCSILDTAANRKVVPRNFEYNPVVVKLGETVSLLPRPQQLALARFRPLDPMPEGLSIDPATGALQGTATSPAAATSIRVEAASTVAFGKGRGVLSLEVTCDSDCPPSTTTLPEVEPVSHAIFNVANIEYERLQGVKGIEALLAEIESAFNSVHGCVVRVASMAVPNQPRLSIGLACETSCSACDCIDKLIAVQEALADRASSLYGGSFAEDFLSGTVSLTIEDDGACRVVARSSAHLLLSPFLLLGILGAFPRQWS